MKQALYTIQEVSSILGVSTKTLRRWEEAGMIKPIRTAGNQRRYRLDDVKKLERRRSLLRIKREVKNEAVTDTPTAPIAAVLQTELPTPEPVVPQVFPRTPTVFVTPAVQQRVEQAEKEQVNNPDFQQYLKPLAGGAVAVIGLIVIFSLWQVLGYPGLHPGVRDLEKRQGSIQNRVLAATTAKHSFQLQVNLPGIFGKKVNFLDMVDIKKALTVTGLSQLNGGIKTNNANINAGTGKLTASNVIYTIRPGSNISISGDRQNPIISTSINFSNGSGIGISGTQISNTGVLSVQGQTGAVTLTGGSGIGISGTTISNTDAGSAQNIFKTIIAGGTNILASSNTDQLTLAAGSGITLTGNSGTKTITITSSGGGGTISGSGTTSFLAKFTSSSGVGNSSIFDNGRVGIGTTSPQGLFSVSGAVAGLALVSLNNTNEQNILVGSSSGTTRFAFDTNGNLNLNGGVYQVGGVNGLTQGSPSCVTTTGGIVTGFGVCQLGSEQWSVSNGALSTGNPTLDLLLGSAATASAKFGVLNISGGVPTASISANSGNNATYLTGDGTLGTANKQTLTIGSIATGNIVLGNSISAIALNLGSDTKGDIYYRNAGGTLSRLGIGSSNQILTVSGTGVPQWSNAGGIVNFWQESLGALSPINSTDDLLLGATATSSAKFAFLNSAGSAIPVASISAQSGTAPTGLSLNGTGALQSLNNGTLTIGGPSTGDIQFKPGNSGTSLYLASNGTARMTSGGGRTLELGVFDSGNFAHIGTTTSHNFQIITNGSTVASFTTNAGLAIGAAYSIGNNPPANGAIVQGSVGIGTVLPLGMLDVRINNATSPTASFSGASTFADTVIDQSGAGDIFTASKSGASKFTVLSNGNIQINNFTTNGGLLYTNASGVVGQTLAGNSGDILQSNGGGAPSWVSAASVGTNFWQESFGAVAPIHINDDLLLGATATSSAKFAFANVAGGTPTASIAGSLVNNSLYVTGDGTLATTNKESLNIGSTSTGNINLAQPVFANAGLAVTSGQNLTLAGISGNNQILYATSGSGVVAGVTATGLINQCLLSGVSNPVWGSCNLGNTTWVQANGTIYPGNATEDLLVGGTATASAKFAFVNVLNGTPTASVSGTTGATSLAANGVFGTTNAQTLTLGTGSTGSLVLAPGGTTALTALTNGNVGIGTTTPGSLLTVSGSVNFTGTTVVGNTNSVAAFGVKNNGGAAVFGIDTVANQAYLAPIQNASAGNQANNSIALELQSNFWNGSSGVNSNYFLKNIASTTAPNYRLGFLNTNSVEVMTLDANGNLGIGATSPLSALDVRDTSATTPIGSFSGQTTFAGLVVDQSGTGDIFTASKSGSTKFVVNNSGNLQFTGGTNFLNTITSLATANQTVKVPSLSGSDTLCFVNLGNCAGSGSGVTASGSNTNYIPKFSSAQAITNSQIYDAGTAVGIGTITPDGYLTIKGSGGGNAGLVVNQIGAASNDIIAASASGTTKFVVTNTGSVKFTGAATQLQTLTSNATHVQTINVPDFGGGSADLCLTSGNCSGAGSGVTQSGSNNPNQIAYFTSANNITSSANFLWNNDLEVSGANGGKAATIINQLNSGDIFTASAAGATKFTIANDGTIADAKYAGGNNTLLYATSANGSFTGLSTSTSNQCLLSGAATPVWGACALGTNYWQLNSNALSPANSTYDLLLGATATTSAKFAFTGNAGAATPVASISAQNGAGTTGLSFNGNGTLQSLNNNTLTIGGATTGNIVLNPNNGAAAGTLTVNAGSSIFSGSVGVGTPTLGQTLSVGGGAVIDEGGANNGFLNINGTQGNGLSFGGGSTGEGIASKRSVGGNQYGLDFYANYANRMSVTNGGNIGINTTSPLAILDIRGTSGTNTLSATLPAASISASTTFAAAVVDQSGLGDIFTASKSGATKFVINNAGNVGIGTATPRSLLTVNGTIEVTPIAGVSSVLQLDSCCGGNSFTLRSATGGLNFYATADVAQMDQSGELSLGVGNGTQAQLDVQNSNYIFPGGYFHGSSGKAMILVNQSGVGDLFTASASGVSKFTVLNNGNLQANNYNSNNGLLYTNGSGVFQQLAAGSGNQCLEVNAGGTALNWATCAQGTNYWSENLGALSPSHITDDLLLGSIATTSAKFAFINVAGGTPTASISGTGNNALSLTGNGTIQTANAQSLLLNPNGLGNVGIGTSTPNTNLEVNGALRLSGTTTDTFTTPQSLSATSKINVPLYNPGNFNQILSLGLPSGASTTSRVISVYDNRAAGNNQPPLGVQAPNEQNIVGLGWDGQNSVGYLKSTGTDLGIESGSTVIANFKTNGSIGIGTANPLGTIDVRGNIATNPIASLSGATTFANTVIDQSGTGDIFTASKSGATKFVITNAGNVGIGTSTPTYNLSLGAANSTTSNPTTIGFNNQGGGTAYRITFDNASGLQNANNDRTQLYSYWGLELRGNTQIAAPATYAVGGAGDVGVSVINSKSSGVALAVVGANGQTADLQDWENASGGVLSAVNASGEVGVGTGTNSLLATLDARALSGTLAVASVSGASTFANLVVDQSGTGDIFTASKSGATKFVINNNGNIQLAGTNNVLSTLASAATSIQTWTLPNATGTLCISGQTCATSGTVGYFQRNNGALAPSNITDDLLLGATATSTAAFAFTNNAGGTPTASISAQSGGRSTYLTGSGVMGTTNAQTLTLGSATTGVVQIGETPPAPFGNTRIGTAGGSDFGLMTAQQFTTPIGTGGTVTSMSVYIHTAVVGGTKMQMAIYSNTTSGCALSAANCPNSLIASTAQVTPTGNSWNTLSINATLSSNTTYWLAFWTNDSSGSNEALVNPSSVGNYFVYGSQTFGASMPATFPALTFNSNTYDASIYASFSGNSGSAIILDPYSGNMNLGYNESIYTSGSSSFISNAQGYTGSEVFGASAQTLGIYATVLGNLAQVTDNRGTAVGYAASSVQNGVALGYGATSVGGGGGVALGYLSNASLVSVAIGQSANAANSYSIALGYQAQTNASNQLVIGGSKANASYITDTYLGSGVTDTAPQNTTIHATGASGSNMFGASLNIAGGTGTGNATGGAILFQTSAPGSSGSTANPLITRMIIDSFGSVGIGATTPSATLDVRGNIATNPIASFSGATTFANTVIDQSGSGDLFTASKSGATKFTILNNGNISFAGSSNFLNTITTAATAARTYTLPDATGTLCISGQSCASSGVVGYFQRNNGALSPTNITDDLLLGATATTSATFAFINVAGGTPMASIAATATNNAAYLDANGNFGTTNKESLTIGNSATYNTTGNVLINPNGTGNVGIGTTTPTTALSVKGAVTVIDSADTTNYFQVNNTNHGTGFPRTFFQGGNSSSDTNWLMRFADVYSSSSNNITAGFQISTNNDASYTNTHSLLEEISNTRATIFTVDLSSTNGVPIEFHTSQNVNYTTPNLYLDTVANGNLVGIGTQAPAAQLDVEGLTGTSAVGYFNGTTSRAILYANNSGIGDLFTASKSGTTKFVITNAGSVGVGTNLPTATLDLRGNVGTNPIASISGATTNAAEIVDQSGIGDIWTASKSGATKFVITNAGNIGVGTAMPSGLFQIENPGLSTTGGEGQYANYYVMLRENQSSGGGNAQGPGIGFTEDNQSANNVGAAIEYRSTGNNGKGGLEFLTKTNTGNGNGPTTGMYLDDTSRLTVGSGVFNGGNLVGALATLDVRSSTGTQSVASVSGATTNAGLIVDNSGSGDIFTASKSGATKFTILNNGYVKANGVVEIGDPTGNGKDGLKLDARDLSGNSMSLYSATGGVDFIANAAVAELNASGMLSIGINNSSHLAQLDVLQTGSYALPDAYFHGATGKATLELNQTDGAADIFTASQGGQTKFTITNAGGIGLGGSQGLVNQCLVSGGTGGAASWATCAASNGFWTLNNGALFESNTTEDLLLGGTATTSAKFAFTNVAGTAIPVASISAVNNGTGVAIGGDGSIQSLQNGTLTLGGSTTGDIQFKAGNASTPNLYLSSGGNVGINTANPTARLYVAGTFKSSSTSTNAWQIQNGNGVILFNGDTSNFRVGIGSNNTSPLATLDVRATSATTAVASVSGASTFANLVVDQSGSGDIFTASVSGATKFVITNAGNVGVGTTTPTAMLNVNQTGSQNILELQNNGTDVLRVNSTGQTLFQPSTDSQTAFRIISHTGGNIFNIDSTSSRVGIGTTTPLAKLDVAGNASISGELRLNATPQIESTQMQTLILGGSVTGDIAFQPGGVSSGSSLYLASSGNVGIGTSAPVATFDIRGNSATTPVASVSGATTFVNTVIDQSGSGDIFTASKSGATKFVITNAGNVGINTNTPGAPLQVQYAGNNNGGSANTTPALVVNDQTGGGGAFSAMALAINGQNNLLLNTDNGGNSYVSSRGTLSLGTSTLNNPFNAIRFGLDSNTNPSMHLSNLGYLGVGYNNVNELATLDVRPSTTLAGANGGTIAIASISGATTNAGLIVDNSGSGDIFTASKSGATKFVINNAGNVGIGTSTPTAPLTVMYTSANSASNVPAVALDNPSGGTQTSLALRLNGSNKLFLYADSGGQGYLGSGNTLNLGTNIINSTIPAINFRNGSMFLDTTGQLGIGTNAGTNLATLDVRGVVATTPIASFSGTTTNASIIVDQSGSGDILTASKSGATKFTVKNSGTVIIGNTTNGIVFDPTFNTSCGGMVSVYCGTARPTKQIVLSPEFAGAVLTASGAASTVTNGFMTSDASPSASAATYNYENYYQWVSSQTSLQQYTVAVRVTLPKDFSAWATSNAVQVDFNTNLADKTSNKMDVIIYNPTFSASTPVLYDQANASTTDKTWATQSYAGSSLSNWSTQGQTAVFYVTLYSKNNLYTQLGDIKLNYLSAF